MRRDGARALMALAVIGMALVAVAARADGVIPEARVYAAAHRGQVEGDRVTWTSTLRLGTGGAVGDRVRLDLAAPARVELEQLPPGVGDVRDGKGRLVGLTVDTAAVVASPTLTLRTSQRLREGMRVGPVQLEAPVVDADVPQLVELRGQESVTFVPDEDLGVVQRLGFSAPVDMRGGERRRLLGLLGESSARPSGAAMWVRPGRVESAGGLRGTLTTADQRRARAGLFLAFGAFLGVVLLVLVLRGLEPAAKVEEAEEVLRGDGVLG